MDKPLRDLGAFLGVALWVHCKRERADTIQCVGQSLIEAVEIHYAYEMTLGGVPSFHSQVLPLDCSMLRTHDLTFK